MHAIRVRDSCLGYEPHSETGHTFDMCGLVIWTARTGRDRSCGATFALPVTTYVGMHASVDVQINRRSHAV